MDQNQNSVQDTGAPAPMMEPAPAEAPKAPAYGPLLGIVLIVIVLVVGAFYVWGERLKMDQPMVPENGVRGEILPDGSVPSVEGSADIEAGPEGPQPR